MLSLAACVAFPWSRQQQGIRKGSGASALRDSARHLKLEQRSYS
jgi:hypothetical protein